MLGDDMVRARRPTGTRIIAVIFEIAKNNCRLVVIRPDTDVVGYRTNGRTPELALANARADGVPVSDMHAMKEFPRWVQRRFFRIIGWQLNWQFHGWALIRQPKAAPAADERAA